MSRREDGSVTVMTIGFFVFLGLLTVVVVNASAAFLAHQRLAAVADGAALAAAGGLSEADFYTAGRVLADAAAAAGEADRYVVAADPNAQVVTEVLDGAVRVRLTRQIDLPLAPPGWVTDTRVTAEATARLLPQGSR